MSRGDPPAPPRAPSLAERQAEALISVIEARRNERASALISEAEAEAARIVAAARARARRRFHEAAETLRREGARRLAQAEATRDGESRRRRREALSALVDRAWPLLAEALEARWREEAARARWIGATLDLAAARLLETDWRIDCAPTGEETLRAALRERGAEGWTLEASGAISAGLRVRAGLVTLDASADALLAQRSRVAAALMAEIDRLSGAERAPAAEAAHG